MGRGLMNRLGSAASLVTLFALGGCGPSDDATSQNSAPPPPAPTVVVATIRSESVPILREFVARTEAVETVAVQARVEALIESLEFTEGRPVEKGAILYRLDARAYEADLSATRAKLAEANASLQLAEQQVSVRAAEAGLTQAEAKLNKAQRDVDRLRPLAEKDAVPRQDLDTAIANQQVSQAEVEAKTASLKNAKIQEEVGILLARAQVEAAEANVALAELDLEYCTIEAPLSGLIGRTQVDVGNLVGRGESTVLATISKIDPIYVTFAISEAEYLELDKRSRARGEREPEPNPIELILADDSVYGETGKIVTAERAVAEETGTLQIVAEFPNSDGILRPGQFGRVRIVINKIPDAVLCPQRAVMEQQSAKVVLVVEANDVVALRTVQILDRHGDDFIVLEGLEKGDRVILEGQLKARPGSPVKPTDRPVSKEPGSQENRAGAGESEKPNRREGE